MAKKLLNVDVALERILLQIKPVDIEEINLADALGRTLAGPIISDTNLPPFANSSMDGYAVRAVDVVGAAEDAPVNLSVVMDITAGSLGDRELQAGQAARIMTGAPIPQGADAIVPVESTNGRWDTDEPLADTVAIYRQVKSGDYIRLAGEDVAESDQILEANTQIRPADLGILAALGRAKVPVFRRPKVVLLPSGDEIVPVDAPLTPGKIRDSNSYTLRGLLQQLGAEPVVMPVAADRYEVVRDQFLAALALQPDLMISSAGASVGAADFMHTVLAELGEVEFWKINLKPGKPFAFGMVRGVPFFGLPGNPVSVMVTFEVLARPAIQKMMGQSYEPDEILATTTEEIHSDGRRNFVRVKLAKDEQGNWLASMTGTQSSGALMSMVLADGLLIVPEDVTVVPAGQVMKVRRLR